MRRPLVFLALVLVPALPARGQFEPEAAPDPAATTARLGQQSTQYWRAGITLRAGATPCGGILGTVPVPLDWPEQKVQIVKEELSPQIGRVEYRATAPGVKQMVVTIPQLQPREMASALVTFEVTRSAILAPEDPSSFVLPTKIPRDVRSYLVESPKIETRDSRIRSQAKELFQEKTTAWEQVEVMYDWVREHVEYRDGKLKGALAALKDGFGDCEELSSLFIAFCRVNGVPARTVWVPGHCYPEFYLEDKAGQGHWFPCQAAGTRDFGGMSEFRPILQKGDNFRVPEEKGGQRYVREWLTVKALRGGGPPEHHFFGEVVPAPVPPR